MTHSGISQNSRKVARNTLLLYFRMLLLTVIGIFTSRVVLNSLGISDYGTYNAVYSMVMMFTIISNSVSNAISRFLIYELGNNDSDRLHKVFSSAIVIQAAMSIVLVILVETVGIRYMHNHLNLPQGRQGAAMVVLQMSAVLLIVQMFSTVFNAVIIAHEDMKAFAYISLLEGALKLGIAYLLYVSPGDKLAIYAILMALVSVITRSAYALFCHRHYEETNGKPVLDKSLLRQMLNFSGWNFTGNAIGVMNSQGISLLQNSFFGVGINAARGIASQVENLSKQFVSNFLTALNPQIIKSYAAGNKDYCYVTVSKGCKFSFLIMLMFVLPFGLEAETILDVWFKDVPLYAATFTRLALICLIVDMMTNSLLQLILATGRIAAYYVISSLLYSFIFILSWIGFAHGTSPEWSYYVYVIFSLAVDALKLVIVHKQADFPVWRFFKDVVFRLIVVCVIALGISFTVKHFMCCFGVWGSVATIVISMVSACISSYFVALTPGEKNYLKEIVSKWKLR